MGQLWQVDDFELKNEVIKVLPEFGPAAAPAVSVLLQITQESPAEKVDLLAVNAAVALVKIGSQNVAASAMSTLREIAESGSPHIRSIAAKSLEDLNVTHGTN
jgi:hypothetical protein